MSTCKSIQIPKVVDVVCWIAFCYIYLFMCLSVLKKWILWMWPLALFLLHMFVHFSSKGKYKILKVNMRDNKYKRFDVKECSK